MYKKYLKSNIKKPLEKPNWEKGYFMSITQNKKVVQVFDLLYNLQYVKLHKVYWYFC